MLYIKGVKGLIIILVRWSNEFNYKINVNSF